MRTEELAHLISREMGKPLAEARGEVKYGTDFVRWYAEEAVRPAGNFRDTPDGGASLLTRRSPVGLAVLITPWNFPLAMATRKIAPALAAGCPVVIKPATLTPLTTYFAIHLAIEAGVTEDLIQVITTSNSGAFSEAVLLYPRVRKVSFTGSTPVGRQLLQLAARNVLRSSIELGGNAPLIIFDDADLIAQWKAHSLPNCAMADSPASGQTASMSRRQLQTILLRRSPNASQRSPYEAA
ncbi:aldehyde dehydrogenase family protein [Paenarthrobacter sp. AT5]|nr:aldehyde dehydrogenase family protein [Paenarthrobacter sp. AT5]WOC62774.1 aldehyde dehydrogenase family protein [Paenarthrobacter sp. AT5]